MNKKEIIINPDKAKRITYVVVFSIVVLLYVIMLKNNKVDHTLGVALIALFVGLTLYFLYSIFFPKAAIIINEDGLKENIIKGAGLIKWNKISEIYICVIPKKKYDTFFLGINYHKDENDRRRVKFKGKVNEKLGDALIVLDGLEMEPYDIYNSIQKYYSKFIKK